MNSTDSTSTYSVQKQSGINLGSWLLRLIQTNEFALFTLLVLGAIAVTARNPRFMAVSNIGTLGRDIALIGILGVGAAFPILLGGIDLSVGSIYGLAGVLVAFFSVPSNPLQVIPSMGLPLPVAVVLALSVGTLFGVFHGLFVSKLKMQSSNS